MRHSKGSGRQRKGGVAVLVAFMMMCLFAFVAMAVDIGYLANTKAELQRTADASAMAAMWKYADELVDGSSTSTAQSEASTVAASTSLLNKTTNTETELPGSGIRWGYVADINNVPYTIPAAPQGSWTNAVQVTVEKSDQSNGKLSFFWGQMAGQPSAELEANATAVMVREIKGFTTPSDGSNLGMLPIALDLDTWNEMLGGNGTDNWAWDEDTQTITPGSDGVLELNLYPKGTGAPGNRGTVDIGSSGNSTNDISRQITDGVSEGDLAYHGGSLELDDNGELDLNGDTGISAGIKDELHSIRGEPKVIPIFREVNGPGNNAVFTIVKWAGVRVMYVKLTGKKGNKQVMIQPASLIVKGVIPATGGSDTSDYVYSTVVLAK